MCFCEDAPISALNPARLWRDIQMAKLLSALIAAVALSFALGTLSSESYACNEKTAAQAEDAAGLIQLAQDESSDEGTDDAGTDEEDGGESSSDGAASE
jgi:hypothetical protein